MNKIWVGIISFLLITVSLFLVFDKKEKSELKKVKVAEVTHSVFYAPQYVAHSLGYFKDENLDVEIILTAGADKVTAAVLSNDVNIGFCGSEATIYVYNEGEKNYLVNFAGLTKRDGSFLVSRTKEDNFSVKDLVGKHVLGGRKNGMPEMTLEWALKENDVEPNSVNIDTSVAFSAMAGAFIGGTGDYVTLFEPQALQLEKQGYGYVVASVGELGGIVPYTVYNARKSYIENNPDVIKGFTKAIQKGLDFVHNRTEEEIAKVIIDYFPDTSMEDLIKIIKRYKDSDSWYKTTYIEKSDFEHVKEIMKSAGALEKDAPYDKLVDTSFSK
ncbi:MAG: ABC transporter substrate-binding protein [Firmicutes bacterium]|nr:ABC transporter substrate-binding protein [Bacillota bacterium]